MLTLLTEGPHFESHCLYGTIYLFFKKIIVCLSSLKCKLCDSQDFNLLNLLYSQHLGQCLEHIQ